MVVDMEAEIRGHLESLIDDLTSEKGLEYSFNIIRGFDPLVKSDEDARAPLESDAPPV